MNKKPCYLCGNDNLTTVVNLDWPIKKCQNCNLIQANPLPTLAQVNALYQGDYWKNFSFYSSQLPAHEEYFRQKVNDIKKIKNHGRLLDVGCAYGSLIKEANKLGFKTKGIDISDYAVKQCKKNDLNAITGVITDIKEKNYYDIVTAFEVVEHERDPLLTIKTASQLLKSNGLLVVSVPNSNSLSAKIMGKYWFGYRHKEHLFHFTKETLGALFLKAGFTNFTIKNDIPRAYLFVYYLERINFYLFKSRLLDKFILILKETPLINRLTVPINLWGNLLAYAVKKDF